MIMTNATMQYLQLVLSFIATVLIPIIILLISRSRQHADTKRQELVKHIYAVKEQTDSIANKLDAHIIWHLNGDK